jgi:hypothetical protein
LIVAFLEVRSKKILLSTLSMPVSKKRKKRASESDESSDAKSRNSSKYKFYAVRNGRTTGVFKNWLTCSKSVLGFKNAVFKGFRSLEDAKSFMSSANIVCDYVDFDPEQINNISTASIASTSSVSMSSNLELIDVVDPVHPSTSSLPSICRPVLAAASEETASGQITNNNKPIHQFLSRSATKCDSCSGYENKIETLITRIKSLEDIVKKQSDAISVLHCKLDDCSRDSRKQFQEFHKNFEHSMLQKCSSIAKSKDSYASKLVSYRDNIHGNNIADKESTLSQATPSQIRPSTSVPHSCLPSSLSKNKIAGNVCSNSTASIRTQNNFAKKVDFEPSKCIVIHDLCTSEVSKINQDVVRALISDKFGPMIIDFVSKYKFTSNFPKFVVQFADAKNVDVVLNGWCTSFFGGSKARKTIKPISYVAYIKGVPLEMTDDKILDDIRKHYSCSSIYRLKSNSDGTPLRTVKINFVDQDNLERALKDKIVFPSFYNLMVNVNLPFSITSNNHHG